MLEGVWGFRQQGLDETVPKKNVWVYVCLCMYKLDMDINIDMSIDNERKIYIYAQAEANLFRCIPEDYVFLFPTNFRAKKVAAS